MSRFCYLSPGEIEEIIVENERALKKATLKELYDFAVEQGLDSGIEFSRYKKALLEIDVDYDALKEERKAR